MAPKKGGGKSVQQHKRKRSPAVQVKTELEGPKVPRQRRICTASRPPPLRPPSASQPPALRPPASRPSASRPPALQPSASQLRFEWFTTYKPCQSYFLNHGQDSAGVQALCEHMNIKLPNPNIQISPWLPHGRDARVPLENLRLPLLGNPSPSGNNNLQQVSLIKYIRRLVCMGLDTNYNLEQFFGSD